MSFDFLVRVVMYFERFVMSKAYHCHIRYQKLYSEKHRLQSLLVRFQSSVMPATIIRYNRIYVSINLNQAIGQIATINGCGSSMICFCFVASDLYAVIWFAAEHYSILDIEYLAVVTFEVKSSDMNRDLFIDSKFAVTSLSFIHSTPNKFPL